MATQNERQLKAVEEELGKHAAAVEEILKKAEAEERESTAEERQEMEDHLKANRELKARRIDIKKSIEVEEDVRETARKFGKSDPPAVTTDARVSPGGDHQDRLMKSIGEMFTELPAYKDAIAARKATGSLPEGFSTPAVSLETKGTLLEGSGSPGSGSGGGLLAVPQVAPGIVDTYFQPLTIADVLGSGQSNGNSIRYMQEGTATSGAAGVAEGGLKPESTLGIGTKDEPIKKIATLLPISEEMLEDAPQVQSYINGRLVLFVRIEEERQLVRGTSGGNEVQGLLTSRGVPVYAGGTAAGNKAVQLFKALNGTRGSSFTEPDFVVLHPSDYQDIRLLADNSGQLFGGGPFFGPYGGPQGPAAIGQGQLTGGGEQVWGKRVVITTATGAGTAVLGSQMGATVFRRGGLNVSSTNSHNDYFQRNLVAIRAEERLGLVVWRPGAFCEIRLA